MAATKILKEYPRDEWLEAADECEYCKSKYEVRIHEVDESGCFGTLDLQHSHSSAASNQTATG